MKKGLKKLIYNIKKINLWIRTVLKEHNDYKLSLYHKLRAIKYGFSSELYNLYKLDINDPHDYISEYQRVLSREINEEYIPVFDNKLIFEKIFRQYVNIPKTVLIVLDRLYDGNGKIIDVNNLDKVLTNDKYIIKPASNTGGGVGVKLITKKNNQYYIDDVAYDNNKMYDELLKHKGYLVCEFVVQHEYSEKINPCSVNTIRIITLKNPETGKFEIPCAVHRFGSKKSGIVDNVSSGGYVSNIDIETGIIGNTSCGTRDKFTDIHPDTGVAIGGTKIPHWEKVKERIIKTATEFPYLPFIAWDIVVTKDDFEVIEINASTGLKIFQVFGSLKNTSLGLFYKHYGYFKNK